MSTAVAARVNRHLDGDQRRCLRLAVLAVIGSRFLIWVASLIAGGLFGTVSVPSGYVPRLELVGSGLGGLVQAPIIRWDGAWYLTIAAHGYAIAGSAYPPMRTNFFPLYPLLVAGLEHIGVPLVLAAFLVSIVCLTLAVYGLARLVTLEWGPGHPWAADATRTLVVAAFVLTPVSFFFSAAYTESLYLALSIGVFLCARRGRWAWAGGLAGLATAARGPALVLLVPLLWIYLFGPREDRPVDRLAAGWRPRYRVRPDILWLALVPAGVLFYMLYLGLSGTGALAFVATQRDYWGHVFSFPWTTVWHGARDAGRDVGKIADGRQHLSLFGVYPGASLANGWENVLPLAALIVAGPAVVGVWRRLPVAYGLYVTLSIVLVLVSPVSFQPLQSMPRYLVILFPLSMWFGAWLSRHPRWRAPLLGASSILLVVLSAEFATWHFVG